ncbi:MAG: TolC family protein [Bacteroidetes bacterium]|nr:TolC family protein [Bacteroidota bacterium]MCY4233157.1 TolC family protein [Bacteroidota bacterium]
MKKSILCGIIHLMVYGAIAQPQPDTLRLDLKQVLEQTLSVSPDIRAALSNVRWADARYALAKSSRFLPDATVSTGFSAVPGINNPNNIPNEELYLDPAVRNDYSNFSPYAEAEISMLQPIYTWGALSGSIKAASAGADLENARAQETIIQASVRAAEFYYNVLLTNELTLLASKGSNFVKMALNEISRLLDEGSPDMDDADRYQVLILQQENERQIVEIQQKSKTAHVALRRQLMLNDSIQVIPIHNSLTPLNFELEDLAYYQNKAMMYRPDILQARAGVTATNALVRVAKADFYPQSAVGIMFGASGASNRFRQRNPYINDSFSRFSTRAGIGFVQKLNFGQTRARVAQAEAQHSSVKHLSIGLEQQVLAEIEQSWRQVAIEKEALAAQDSSLAISKEWLRVEQINFDLDLGDTENLIDAVQSNLKIEAAYYEAVRRYNMALIELLASAGILTQEMDSFTETQ